jgi:hypothetical protein
MLGRTVLVLCVLLSSAQADPARLSLPLFMDTFYLEGADIQGSLVVSGNLAAYHYTDSSLFISPKKLDSWYSQGTVSFSVSHKKSRCEVSIEDGSYQEPEIRVSNCNAQLHYVQTKHTKNTHDYTLIFSGG